MDLIESILKKRANYQIYQASFVCYRAQKVFDKIFSKNNIKVIAFGNKNLKIKTNNKFLITEIKIKQEQILDQINKSIGKILIKKITIR